MYSIQQFRLGNWITVTNIFNKVWKLCNCTNISQLLYHLCQGRELKSICFRRTIEIPEFLQWADSWVETPLVVIQWHILDSPQLCPLKSGWYLLHCIGWTTENHKTESNRGQCSAIGRLQKTWSSYQRMAYFKRHFHPVHQILDRRFLRHPPKASWSFLSTPRTMLLV